MEYRPLSNARTHVKLPFLGLGLFGHNPIILAQIAILRHLQKPPIRGFLQDLENGLH